ncbi:non-homologous end-joining DNA ligase [Pseudalkalibacillus hwajinpoensis]|uniref:non-homologous end-joining DNA ligase n=1 Tax=Guptibacillus hwajinpoensis TaxID=208199 RepID=UPI00325A6EF1
MTRSLLPMLPTLSSSFPGSEGWIYEVKYDGYRAILDWDGETIQITSRNGHHLNKRFQILHDALSSLFVTYNIIPCCLDGEICILKNEYCADFESLHKRKEKPITFMVFDLLTLEKKLLLSSPLHERKKALQQVLQGLPDNRSIAMVHMHETIDGLWELVQHYKGEGVVCKKHNSLYREGKRTENWLKIKNWKSATVFLNAYDHRNGYFHTAVKRSGGIYEIARFSHGLSSEERGALLEIIKGNTSKEKQSLSYVKPGIVLELEYLDLYNEMLRHPRFKRFCFQKPWEDCTWETIQSSLTI